MTDRPKILYICGYYPCPATFGAKLRILNIGRILQKISDLKLVVVSPLEPNEEETEKTRACFGDFYHLIPTKTWLRA